MKYLVILALITINSYSQELRMDSCVIYNITFLKKFKTLHEPQHNTVIQTLDSIRDNYNINRFGVKFYLSNGQIIDKLIYKPKETIYDLEQNNKI